MVAATHRKMERLFTLARAASRRNCALSNTRNFCIMGLVLNFGISEAWNSSCHCIPANALVAFFFELVVYFIQFCVGYAISMFGRIVMSSHGNDGFQYFRMLVFLVPHQIA
jgi:hypothetical protein